MAVAHMGRFNIMRAGKQDHLVRGPGSRITLSGGESRSLRLEWAGRDEHQAGWL